MVTSEVSSGLRSRDVLEGVQKMQGSVYTSTSRGLRSYKRPHALQQDQQHAGKLTGQLRGHRRSWTEVLGPTRGLGCSASQD